MPALSEIGCVGFTGNSNGSLRGPELVMENGFQWFDFTRVVKIDRYGVPHTIEFLFVGKNSLQLIAQPGAIIEKLQPASFETITAQSLESPSLTNVAPVPLGKNGRRQIMTWPPISRDSAGSVYKSYFVNLIIGLDLAVGNDPRAVLHATRSEVFNTLAREIIHQVGADLGSSPEFALRVMGYDERPISDKRTAELMSDYSNAVERLLSSSN